MEATPKSQKTYKIKKKTTIIHPKESQKTIKIAKKISQSTANLPFPQSIQEDFLLENDDNPLKFFANEYNHPYFEIVHKKSQLKPIKKINLYAKKQTLRKFMEKSNNLVGLNKFINNFANGFDKMIKNGIPVDLDEEINKRKKLSQEQEMKSTGMSKIKSPINAVFEKQTKSLDKFVKQQVNWEKIECFISEKLQKNPEELALNSGRIFTKKVKVMSEIDHFFKTNDAPSNVYWKNSLRGNETQRFSISLPELPSSCKHTPMQSREVLKHTKNLNPEYMSLKNNLHFHERLKRITSDKPEDILHTIEGKELMIQGIDKIKLEYDIAMKIGPEKVKFHPIEPFSEQTLESNYDVKVIY